MIRPIVAVVAVLVSLTAACTQQQFDITDFSMAPPGNPPYVDAVIIQLGFGEAKAKITGKAPVSYEYIYIFARDKDTVWRVNNVVSTKAVGGRIDAVVSPRLGSWQLKNKSTAFVMGTSQDSNKYFAILREGKEFPSLPQELKYSRTVIVKPTPPLLIPISESPLNWRKWVALKVDIEQISGAQYSTPAKTLHIPWWRGGETLISGTSSLASEKVLLLAREDKSDWKVQAVVEPDQLTGEFEAWYGQGVGKQTARLVAAAGSKATHYRRGDTVSDLPSTLLYSKTITINRD